MDYSFINQALECGFDLLAYKKCIVCQTICSKLPLCLQCETPFNRFDISTQKTCTQCREPSHSKICQFCKKNSPLARFDFLYYYTENTRNSIQKMKYAPSRRLLNYFAYKIIEYALINNLSNNWDAIIPIPSSKQALRKRKLHTTYLLAKPLSQFFKTPVLPFVLQNTSCSTQALTTTTKQRISHAKEHIRINKKYSHLLLSLIHI